MTAADDHHPWPDAVAAPEFGSDSVRLTKVQPPVIAEITADAARHTGSGGIPSGFIRTAPI